MKRSNKPIFWSLFGAGGMLSALAAPALIVVTGIALPLGWVPLAYERAHALALHPLGKLALVALIGLFLFHGCHRMYHCVHDFGVHVGPGMKAAFHGFAALGTLAAIWLVLSIPA
jgi:fumarate reductase subunit D